jgi:hypothetical protein
LECFEELVEAALVNRKKSTEANDATSVDMDSKFYDSAQKGNNSVGNRNEFVLNPLTARKRKRRFMVL